MPIEQNLPRLKVVLWCDAFRPVTPTLYSARDPFGPPPRRNLPKEMACYSTLLAHRLAGSKKRYDAMATPLPELTR